MNRAFFALLAFFVVSSASAAPPVIFESPCECRDAHGKGRWSVKNDSSLPPADASTIQSVTPSDIFRWPGPDVHLTWQSDRTGIENNWFALTGRVVTVKAEADGDLQVALQDATGATSRGSWSAKYQQSLSGARHAQLFLAGRGRDFLSTSARQENLR